MGFTRPTARARYRKGVPALDCRSPLGNSRTLCGRWVAGVFQCPRSLVGILAVAELVGGLSLKDFVKPVPAYNLCALKD